MPVKIAIVITTLDTVPFCCHEDLLTMSRSQLVQVATTLNARLPALLRIDTSLNRSDSFIRNSIEVIVGLRRDVPPAPKAVKMRSGELRIDDDRGISGNCSPPTSPLARLSARERQGSRGWTKRTRRKRTGRRRGVG